jgi:hypothetical protein
MGTHDTGERRRSLVRHRHHRQRPHARWRVWPNGYPVLRLASDRERCRGQRSNQPGRALSVELYADAAVSLSADEALCKNYPPCGRSVLSSAEGPRIIMQEGWSTHLCADEGGGALQAVRR